MACWEPSSLNLQTTYKRGFLIELFTESFNDPIAVTQIKNFNSFFSEVDTFMQEGYY